MGLGPELVYDSLAVILSISDVGGDIRYALE